MPSEYSFDERFQRKILSLFIREPQKAYSIVQPEFFTNPIHLDLARITKQLYDKHNIRDSKLSKETLSVIIKNFLGRKREEVWPEYKRVIGKIFDDDLTDESVIIEQSIQFAKERKFRQALVSAEKDINNSKYEAALRRFEQLKNFGVERDLGIEYWADPGDPLRWRDDRKGQIGTFYLSKLDQMMEGGPGEGELVLVFAGGKAGKSTVLANVAAGGMWQNKNVAIATGELSAKKYRKRIDCRITGYSSRELTRLSHLIEMDRKKLSKESLRMLRHALDCIHLMHKQMKGKLYIKQWPTGKGRIRDIEAWLDQLEDAKGEKIELLIVDYVRTFRPNTDSDDHRINIGEVSLNLRGVASSRNIPVWSAQQVKRTALNKERFSPDDIAEDISQFWTLDFGIAFCQTEQEAKAGKFEIDKYGRRGRELKPEKARIYLMSARDVGQGGVVEVEVWRDTFKIVQRKKAA
jgi:hypothetical protein